MAMPTQRRVHLDGWFEWYGRILGQIFQLRVLQINAENLFIESDWCIWKCKYSDAPFWVQRTGVICRDDEKVRGDDASVKVESAFCASKSRSLRSISFFVS